MTTKKSKASNENDYGRYHTNKDNQYMFRRRSIPNQGESSRTTV
jgi:hypothetical protein